MDKIQKNKVQWSQCRRQKTQGNEKYGYERKYMGQKK